MTKRLINESAGMKVWHEYDHVTDQMVITHEQDVTAALNKAAAMRQDSEKGKRGIKNDWLHYAIVPNAIQMEMYTKHGVKFWDRADKKKVFQLLETEYSKFKVSEIRHSVKDGGI